MNHVHPFPLPLSICTIAHNEERYIADCLESVLGKAAEVVVLDAGSEDRTAEIVERYQKTHPEIVLIQTTNNPNLNVNKTKTFEAATQDWLFYLDADERMTPELWQEIADTLPVTDCQGFEVGRKNFYFSHWLRYGGMYPEKQPRLFQRGKGHFALQHVHESLAIEGKTGELAQPFLHYSYEGVSQFMKKLDFYTTFQAQIWHQKGLAFSLSNHFTYAFLRPLLRFGQKYFLLAGWRDGFWGFFAAWMSGISEFIAYCKIQDVERGVIEPLPSQKPSKSV